METFKTFKNNQQICLNVVKIETIAQQLNEIAFFLRNNDNLNDFDILDNETPKTTKFSKKAAEKKAILEASISFMVDSGQLSQKQKIMKETVIRYSVFDKETRDTYFSTFTDFSSEYFDDGEEQFTIIKKIEIVFKENVLENQKAFVKSLKI